MLSATVAYRNAANNLDRSLEIVSKSPLVARETANYLSKISSIKSIDDFMANKRVLRYALKAHGLEDMTYAAAFVRRLLEGGLDSPQALANRLSDQRYRDFVTTFNFARNGAATTAFDRTQKGTVELYNRQVLEVNTGTENEGARLALYFRRKAPNVTSPLQVLADAALLKVVQTGAGLTPYMSTLSLDAQIESISQKLDVADFKNPAKLEKFIGKFTALWDINNSSAASAGIAPVGLANQSTAIGVDLISAIQRSNSRK